MQVSLNSKDDNTDVFWYMDVVDLVALENIPQETLGYGSIFVAGRGDALRPGYLSDYLSEAYHDCLKFFRDCGN